MEIQKYWEDQKILVHSVDQKSIDLLNISAIEVQTTGPASVTLPWEVPPSDGYRGNEAASTTPLCAEAITAGLQYADIPDWRVKMSRCHDNSATLLARQYWGSFVYQQWPFWQINTSWAGGA